MRNEAMKALWASIPPMACKGLCQESCGPIAMSTDEDECLQEHGVTIPPVDGALRLLMAMGDKGYTCPALVDGRCSVYDERPMLCRLWGASPAMPCPHGCEPTVTVERSAHLMGMSLAAGGGVSTRIVPQ